MNVHVGVDAIAAAQLGCDNIKPDVMEIADGEIAGIV